jgi:receptor expression-enhancing protein 1/2/3/4
MLLGRVLARPLCHFLGYLYPSYQSYKAIKLNDATQHTQWLTFWIVSTYISLLEVLGDSLLFWLPFYYEAKVLLLGWLVLPYFRGASVLYDRVVSPYLHRYEKEIDASVAQLKDSSGKQLSSLGQLGLRHLRSQSAELLRMGTNVLMAPPPQQQHDGAPAAEQEQERERMRDRDREQERSRKERKQAEGGIVS